MPFLCLHAGDIFGQRHYIFGLSIHPFVHRSVHPILWIQYLRNHLKKFLQIWRKCSLGHKEDVIRFCWLQVKGHSDRIPIPFLWMLYIRNAWGKFHYIWHKCPLALKDVLIRIWWLKIKCWGLCELPKCIFNHNSRILMTTFHTNV